MNREKIIRMAREAGLPEAVLTGWEDELERFACLVAAAERRACERHFEVAMRNAVTAEREALIDLVDDYAKNNDDLKAAIRARGNEKRGQRPRYHSSISGVYPLTSLRSYPLS